MPTYVFKNKETGEVVEHEVKMSDYDQFMEEHKNLERYYDSGHVGALIRGINQKPAAGFREILTNIKKKHRRSTINDF